MQLVALARNPVPSGPVVGTFRSTDGLDLRFARWAATRSPRRGTVVILTGRGEPIEKYFEVVADLRRRGFAVAIHDWRGQGGSARMLPDPMKGHVKSFAQYDADLTRFMRDVVLPDCPPPFIALCHSMGGCIVMQNATIVGSWFDRMVLSAPMLAFDDSKVPTRQSLARLWASVAGLGPLGRLYVPGGKPIQEEMKGFDGNALTSDPERFLRNRQIFEANPALGVGSPTNAWIRAAYRAMDAVMDPKFAQRIRIPMLLVAAGQDRIVSSAAIEQFANRLKIGARVVIGGARHEILQETDDTRQRFWAAFDAYLGVSATAGRAA